MTDLARLLTEDRVVRVLCALVKETMVKDSRRTWWEPNGNLTTTGVRTALAAARPSAADRAFERWFARVEPPCDTECR